MAASLRKMAEEMSKAGLMSEMMDEAFEMIEDPDLEDEADEEVDKVMFELTEGQFGKLPAAPVKTPAAVSGPLCAHLLVV